MALEALFHQSATAVGADDLRRILSIYENGSPGVFRNTDFAGSAASGTVFRCAGGLAVVPHNTSGAGTFLVYSDGNADVTINAPGSGSKYVTVYLRVRDSTLGDGASAATVTTREETTATYGVPAGQSGIELYRIRINAGQTLTSGAIITNYRKFARPWNAPWGVQAALFSDASLTIAAEEISAFPESSGSTNTFNAVDGRLYMVTNRAQWGPTTSTNNRGILGLSVGGLLKVRLWEGTARTTALVGGSQGVVSGSEVVSSTFIGGPGVITISHYAAMVTATTGGMGFASGARLTVIDMGPSDNMNVL